MRYDTKVYFRQFTRGSYNAITGNYDDDRVTELERRANVTDTGTETLRLIYGGLRQGSKVVRLPQGMNSGYDTLRIGDKIYSIDYVRQLKPKAALIVSEVQ